MLLVAAAMPLRAQEEPVSTEAPPAKNVGVLHPGDLLDILVYQNEDLSGKFIIDSRGYLQMPGVGTILVAGLDPTTVKDTLSLHLKRIGLTDPSLSVIPQIRIQVLGEVRDQGPKVVDPGPSMLEALGLAGGATERADLEKSYVIRDGKPYAIDLEEALAGGFPGTITLFSNDVLVVPRKRGLTRENLSLLMSLLSVALGLANVIVAAR